ncbi:MAG: hypothetical protein CFE44_08650 [Burkholderiales bacterium PBB4]|nr:MAG: hypothetical protein CFE44_08650 [Burkholderiales bacterium PBB4]
MRINLVTPFAEKDAVKALGARWDGTKKVWYITDVPDLTPFMRWIPDLKSAQGTADTLGKTAPHTPTRASPGVITKRSRPVIPCGCRVLPWEHCEHSAPSGV